MIGRAGRLDPAEITLVTDFSNAAIKRLRDTTNCGAGQQPKENDDAYSKCSCAIANHCPGSLVR